MLADIGDTKLPPRQSLPTGRLATQPPTRMPATERPPTRQPITEKLSAERLATEHPAVAARDVLCLMASQLALFTGAIPVLELCRAQDRRLRMRIGHAQPFISRVRGAVAMLPLPSPMSLTFATHRAPNRSLLARLFFYDIGRQLRNLFFQIWRVALYTPESRNRAWENPSMQKTEHAENKKREIPGATATEHGIDRPLGTAFIASPKRSELAWP